MSCPRGWPSGSAWPKAAAPPTNGAGGDHGDAAGLSPHDAARTLAGGAVCCCIGKGGGEGESRSSRSIDEPSSSNDGWAPPVATNGSSRSSSGFARTALGRAPGSRSAQPCGLGKPPAATPASHGLAAWAVGPPLATPSPTASRGSDERAGAELPLLRTQSLQLLPPRRAAPSGAAAGAARSAEARDEAGLAASGLVGPEAGASLGCGVVL
mmetsp:Transcript_2665/g.9282  ORF Transcript_2665/g.9282 Transcript_2665/m.9282 type:complete len:211 (+) Transcript_2665:496-1128(+)